MGILVPIFVCFVLPVAIVAINAYTKINQDNKRSKILIKAIESNNNIDADRLAVAMSHDDNKKATPRQLLNRRLLRGCIFTLVGLVLVTMSILSYASGVEFYADPVFMPALFGGISIAIGLSYLIVFFITRNQAD